VSTDPYLHLDAAYVLDALEPGERAEFEAHLATCPQCRARVDELVPLPGLLAGLPEDAFRGDSELIDEPVPDTLLPGLLRRGRRERQRRRGLTAVLTAVAAACLIALVVVAWPSPKPHVAPAQAMTAVVASPVSAKATLTGVRWGTKIHLDCYYTSTAGPDTAELKYSLTAVPKSGQPENLGSWTLTPGKETEWDSGTSLSPSQISQLQITVNGKVILQLAE
jgi:hypothetical protein